MQDNYKFKSVIVSGGFDPLHSGHIMYLKHARALGHMLTVGVNSDEWLIRKKGKFFLPHAERMILLEAIKYVDLVMYFDDTDGSAKNLIRTMKKFNPDAHIIFANGGDRTEENIPEMVEEFEDVEFVFGVGGEYKMNSSSKILEEWDRKVGR